MSHAPRPLSLQAAHRLILDTEPFLSCDDCFDLVDRYVDALLSDPGYDHPAMRTHLAGCAACAEEARSLVWLAAEERGLDPAAALRRLDDGPA